MVTSPKLIAPFQSGRAMVQECPADRLGNAAERDRCVAEGGDGALPPSGRSERASSTATASWAACASAAGTGLPFMSIAKLSVWPLAVVT